MPPRHTRSSSHHLILFPLLALSQCASAALSLQVLQAIANFPPNCQAAYQVTIPSCPDTSLFSLSGPKTRSSLCTEDCKQGLKSATIFIQNACRGSAAPPGTVIAHAFAGDLPQFLCDINDGSNLPPSSDTNPSTTSAANPSPTSSSKPSKSDPASASASEVASSTKTPNSTSSTLSPSSSATSSSSAAPSSQTVSPSASKASPPSSSSSSSSSTTTRTVPTLNPGGGGTPFDQTVPNDAPGSTMMEHHSMLSLVITVAFALVFGV